MELNFEGLQMQKWNTQADRAQKVDQKNGVICLVIMFNSWVMVIKTSKMAHFLYFLMMSAFLIRASERSYRSYLALQEDAMDCCILSYH